MGSVWVLQHLEAEPAGNLETGLSAAGLQLQTFRSDLGGLPPRIEPSCGGLIVMGGPMGVNDAPEHPWIDPEIKLIRGALAAGLPILGICLGSQLLAAAAGAPVYPGERPAEIGWDTVRLSVSGQADALCAPLLDSPGGGKAGGATGGEATVFQWHGDTFDLPAGAELLASSRLYPHQAFRLGSAYGFQFHFEVTAEIIGQWLELWPAEARAAGLETGATLEETALRIPSLEARAAGLISAFAALVSSTVAEPLPA